MEHKQCVGQGIDYNRHLKHGCNNLIPIIKADNKGSELGS